MRRRATSVRSGFACGAALLASLAAGCPAPTTPAPPVIGAASGARPQPADETLRALVEIGPRQSGSPALARARSWATSQLDPHRDAAQPRAPALVLLAASLDAPGPGSASLAEQSAGAAAVLEVARTLARGQPPLAVDVVLLEGAPGSPAWRAALGSTERVAAAELVVFVARACGLPARRDLLSHRVLRERFFSAAGAAPPPNAFEQASAPHAELAAAGARRIVALDAPATGPTCSPAAMGDALARFIRDASVLLARGRGEPAAPPPASGGSNLATEPAS